jgi:uncharacterized protein (UPF0332 family)
MKRTIEETAAFRLEKSTTDFDAANILALAQNWSGAVNRLYYASFHTVSALLLLNGIKIKSHSGAKAMLELHFVKTGKLPVEWGKFYASLFNDRNDSDYEDFAVFTADDILPLLPQAQAFIDVIKRLITIN